MNKLVAVMYAAIFVCAAGDCYFGGLSVGWTVNIGLMCFIIARQAQRA